LPDAARTWPRLEDVALGSGSGGAPDDLPAFYLGLGLAPGQLRAAVARARALRVTLDRVLVCQGLVSEERLYRALAETLGAEFVTAVPGTPVASYRREALVSGCVRVAGGRGGRQVLLVAPEREGFERLARATHLHWRAGTRLLVTTPRVLRAWALAVHAPTLTQEAANHLLRRMPEMSARGLATRSQLLFAGFAAVLLPFGLTLDWLFASRLLFLALGPLFAIAAAARLASALRGRPSIAPVADAPPLDDGDLPPYGVLCALYREADMVPGLLRALSAIDYPPEKLAVKMLIEADDRSTLGALRDAPLPPWFEVVVAPHGEPRTKPRALNFALPFLEDGLVTVYDAEDRPDPRQLRHAASAFAVASPEVACLQARLVIDNAADRWLTRCFALEYAALFDRVIPGLARLRLPVCLGGTSNHFRARALVDAGGWDAWNVTEDADLGVRLARLGYLVGSIESDTAEEAPNTVRAWTRQRARWLKGWMQTILTHTRQPGRLGRQLGWRKAAVALPFIAATILAPLLYPFALAFMAVAGLQGRLLWWHGWLGVAVSVWAILVAIAGVASVIGPMVLATRDRRSRRLLGAIAYLPIYYGLVSAAAWIALRDLLATPFHWNKTEHGKARTGGGRLR
jgi:cellulose synthase/poly-beta-1,6-N-acetylglucosamine synthase-like glycosyltransferase